MSEPIALWTRREARALRALQRSGRRLVRRRQGWAVLEGGDLRNRARIELTDEEGARLIAAAGLKAASAGPGYVASEQVAGPSQPGPGPMVFAAAGIARSRMGGAGFVGLARRAEGGEGPLTLRAVQAGLRVIQDAEISYRRPGLTMNWDAIPADRGRRSAGSGGLSVTAREADERLRLAKAALGEAGFGLVWRACVEAEPLTALARQTGIAAATVVTRLGAALERLADTYDAGR